jgi:hypothetical protein
LLLFDKLIEERETQAAVSLRILASTAGQINETLANTAFHAITRTAGWRNLIVVLL